jgi:hypothetical protein
VAVDPVATGVISPTRPARARGRAGLWKACRSRIASVTGTVGRFSQDRQFDHEQGSGSYPEVASG